MAKLNLSCFGGFPAVMRKNTAIRPAITLVNVKGTHNCSLSYAGNNLAHLARLREVGAYRLPQEVNYSGDAVRHGINIKDWCFHNARALFEGEIEKHMDSKGVIITNAGNAPMHDWEVNFSRDQAEPLASRDWEVQGRPMLNRVYYCAKYSPDTGMDIGYVRFTEDGLPGDKGLEVAVGGRPLVHEGRPVSLGEVLKTSLTDPRHVIMFPEVDLGSGTLMPLGLRTVQHAIREYRYEEIVEDIRQGRPFLIDLEKERGCCGDLTEGQVIKALSLFDYGKDDFELDLSRGTLRIKYKLNHYRHTFWAKQGYQVYIGIIGNQLEPNDDGFFDDLTYRRFLKPAGLTIPQLQEYIVEQLHADEAVLMGNGKDPRIYAPDVTGDTQQVKLYSTYMDNDSSKVRDTLTGGLISLVIH